MKIYNLTESAKFKDKQMQLISDTDAEIIYIINYGILNFSICLFGVVANVVNIIVFFKQGFNTTINISFFGLAISDLCSLVTLMWLCVCMDILVAKSGIPIMPLDIIHLTAGIPHGCFARITGWITVYITAERCLCITIPLKIKQIITPRVTTITFCFIYVVNFLSFVPEFETSYITWIFYSQRNKTLLGIAFKSNRKEMEGLAFMIYAVLGQSSFIAVIMFTVILVVQLQKKSKWRMQSTQNQTESITNREKKTVTMIVMIATVLIVSYIPGVVICMSSFLLTVFSFQGTQYNLWFVTWSFAFIFEAINSSVNIFLYYKMSTKYRETFNEVFARGKKVNTDGELQET